MSKIIIIKITPEQSEKFQQFLACEEDFNALLEGGVFNFKNGSRIIHKDENGIIQTIAIGSEITYKRKGLDKGV